MAPPLLQVRPLERNYTGLLVAPDGAIWLAASKDNAIVRMMVKGPATTLIPYQIPAAGASPWPWQPRRTAPCGLPSRC